MMKEDPGVSKAQAWGLPHAPQEIFKETQASKLGGAPMHPLLHQQSSVRPSPHYIFIASHDMCCSCSVCIFAFSFVWFCFLVIIMSDPCMLDWQIYTLHFIIEHPRASLISVEC